MNAILEELGLNTLSSGAIGNEPLPAEGGATLSSYSPIDGGLLGEIPVCTPEQLNQLVEDSVETFHRWRLVPAPKRGELIREIADRIRKKKRALGGLVSLETGKILAEGEGEIQEVIDIADFAVGLSRQLYGSTMHSERPGHRMYEQWHPLGVVGVITAFNFPAAVWGWNAMVAAVCGDTLLWKPSEIAPLTALAMNRIARDAAAEHGFPALFSLAVADGPELGQRIAEDPRIPLVSATGSCRMGRAVAETVSKRLGRTLLELGGNNAVIVMDNADLNLVIPAVVFGAVGTAGQRCTTTRRLYVQEPLFDEIASKLSHAYKQVKIGDPLREGTLMGPLIHEAAVSSYEDAMKTIKAQGGEILYGGARLEGYPSELYVQPTLVKASADMEIVAEETFAPILYLIPFKDLDQAIELQNSVPQGLSSAIFTTSVRSAEQFLSHAGSDCGIANVNIGTSGAEIGGAFGGEKDTGGGRESGSDSWKQYMRRQTNTINYSEDLPLAQGITFDLS